MVLGAESFITANLQGKALLANGTPCIPHSFTFDTPNKCHSFEHRYRAAMPGEVVTLTEQDIPYSLNVIPWPKDEDNKKLSMGYSLMKRSIVVPLGRTRTWSHNSKEEAGCIVMGGSGFDQSKAFLHDRLPIDLGFAMTFDKVQGRTMKKIILVLEHRPTRNIDFHLLLVSLSRTCGFSSMHFLTHNGRPAVEALKHLCDLEPSADVMQFLAGYNGAQGCLWNANLALNKKWQMEQDMKW